MALQKTLWQSLIDLVSTGQNASDQFDIAFGNIDDAIDQIDTNILAIAGVDTRVQDLEATGITVRAGANLTPQTIGVTATKVINFDTTLIEAGVGTIWDAVNLRMTATLDGIFKLRYESFITYASNVDITWQIYKNGVPFGNSITLSGQGTTVFPLVLLSSASLLTDDYLELYATASASTTLTISQANGTLEKTHF